MDELYRSYLSFLRSMSRGLESLTGLNEKKLTAAQQEDLMGLNDLLNQEQAQALNFRGLELTRDKLLPQLGLEGVPLEQVPRHFPPAMQEEARQAPPGGERHCADGRPSLRRAGGTRLRQGAGKQRPASVHENGFPSLTSKDKIRSISI